MPGWRFSLRSFLLSLFMVCLIGSNFFTAWELNRAREDNRRLRTELGELVISDPRKLHVVTVPTYEDLTYRWRILIPEGQVIRILQATREIPQSGYPANFGASYLPEGEYVLTVAVRRDHLGQWRLTATNPQGSVSMGIAQEDSAWLVDSPGASTSQAGAQETESFDPGERIVLLRDRTMQRQPDGSASSTPEPCDGIMIWLEPEK